MNQFYSYETDRFRLQPIVRLKDNFYYGWEVLNVTRSVLGGKPQLKALTASEIFMLFLQQVNCVMDLEGTFFLNLPVCILSEEIFVDIILSLRGRKHIAIELQDPALLTTADKKTVQKVARNIQRLRTEGWVVWLDSWEKELHEKIISAEIIFDGVKLGKAALEKHDLDKSMTLVQQLSTNIVVQGIERETHHHYAKSSGSLFGQGLLWKELKCSRLHDITA